MIITNDDYRVVVPAHIMRELEGALSEGLSRAVWAEREIPEKDYSLDGEVIIEEVR